MGHQKFFFAGDLSKEDIGITDHTTGTPSLCGDPFLMWENIPGGTNYVDRPCEPQVFTTLLVAFTPCYVTRCLVRIEPSRAAIHKKKSSLGQDSVIHCKLQVTYQEGSVITIETRQTAAHGGFYEFAICDSTDITQECFDRNTLKSCASPSLPSCTRCNLIQ